MAFAAAAAADVAAKGVTNSLGATTTRLEVTEATVSSHVAEVTKGTWISGFCTPHN